jgi:hypothetical protein
MSAKIEHLNGARAAFLPHKVGNAAEDQRCAVCRPARIGGVAIFIQESLRTATVRGNRVELPGLARLPSH